MSRLHLLLPFVLAAIGYAQSDLEVATTYGPVLGHYSGDGSVREFLGIPFAAPPIGDLRWEPAQAPENWTETFDAAEFGPSCHNTAMGGGFGHTPIYEYLPKPPVEDEDCLTVNVWAPRETSGKAAVLLWVYGGGFAIGGSFTPIYNGTRLVTDQEDVIVVNFNYRVNVFGFSGAPVLGDNRNLGLLDIRVAVEWVRDNIAAFGGDPSKITLFGESAGATATDMYLFANEEDPIIAGAIMESGTGGGSFTTPMPPTPWSTIASIHRCTNTDRQAELACMRQIPGDVLRDSVLANNLLSFRPIVDNGVTVPANILERLRAGQYARVPVIVGSNDQEFPDSPISTLSFTCPGARSARYRSRFGKAWHYRYFGNYPTGYEGYDDAGSFHTAEIPLVFGTYNRTAATPELVESSKYIQGAWAAFAKDPENGLSEYGWPLFNENESTLVRLSYNNVPGATFVEASLYESGCTW